MDERISSFIVRCIPATPAVGDQLLTLQNRDPYGIVHVWGVNVCIGSLTAVTGILTRLTLYKVTTTAALAGGTDLTSGIITMDTWDTLLSTISAVSKTTTTLSSKKALGNLILSQDEPTVSVLDSDMQNADLGSRNQLFWVRGDWAQCNPVFLRSDGTTHEALSIEVAFGDPGGSNLECTMHFTVEGG